MWDLSFVDATLLYNSENIGTVCIDLSTLKHPLRVAIGSNFRIISTVSQNIFGYKNLYSTCVQCLSLRIFKKSVSENFFQPIFVPFEKSISQLTHKE